MKEKVAECEQISCVLLFAELFIIPLLSHAGCSGRLLSERQIIWVYHKIGVLRDRKKNRKRQSKRGKLLEKLKRVQHSWQCRSSVHHWSRAFRAERLLLSTSGPFDHSPHCQVPPAVCFIISPSKCLGLAKSNRGSAMCVQMSFWTAGFNRWIGGISGKQHDFTESCQLCKVVWRLWEERFFVSICGIYYKNTDLRQNTSKRRRALREITWQEGRLICTKLYIPVLLLAPCPAEGNKTCTQ